MIPPVLVTVVAADPRRLKPLELKLIPFRFSPGMLLVGCSRVTPVNNTLAVLVGAPKSQFATVLQLLSPPKPCQVLVWPYTPAGKPRHRTNSISGPRKLCHRRLSIAA